MKQTMQNTLMLLAAMAAGYVGSIDNSGKLDK